MKLLRSLLFIRIFLYLLITIVFHTDKQGFPHIVIEHKKREKEPAIVNLKTKLSKKTFLHKNTVFYSTQSSLIKAFNRFFIVTLFDAKFFRSLVVLYTHKIAVCFTYSFIIFFFHYIILFLCLSAATWNTSNSNW